MNDLVVEKFRGLQDCILDGDNIDCPEKCLETHIYENKGRKLYAELQKRTNVKVSILGYSEIFAKTIGYVSMIIDNKGKMEDDKAYGLLFLCADVFATMARKTAQKTGLLDWINQKLTITYEQGYVPFLFEYYSDRLTSLDTMMILSLDLAMTMGYCSEVKGIAYETISGNVIYHEFNKEDDNTVKAESTLTEGMKKEFSDLYEKCDNGDIDCNEYINALYDVAENKGGSDNV